MMFYFTVLILAIYATRAACGLGGKSFHESSSHDVNDTDEGFIFVTTCDERNSETRRSHLSVTLEGTLGNVTVNASYFDTVEPFRIEHSIGEARFVHIESTPPSDSNSQTNYKRATVGVGQRIYKLHLNDKCDQSSEFWTSDNSLSIWESSISCEMRDVLCDMNTDLPIGRGLSNSTRTPTIHLFLRSGITFYKTKAHH
ncbi:hypothetical protein QR680_000433 [Steinernema hermaphroditum]|uniref:Reelin domain-containing protein n=1 Tax=Steinernema hermaphroditum TaxID=289476 RepID=A0AA39GW48_9BILA|nr:hypothetical protein QR680_000433 [Steinernema hermaphroditum]